MLVILSLEQLQVVLSVKTSGTTFRNYTRPCLGYEVSLARVFWTLNRGHERPYRWLAIQAGWIVFVVMIVNLVIEWRKENTSFQSVNQHQDPI